LTDYSKEHPDFGGEFFVCLYDGWREYSEPIMPPADRQYVPWTSLPTHVKASYLGPGNAKEPRFRHPSALSQDPAAPYPNLPRKVLTYNRHKYDTNALLIPDSEFLETKGFSKLHDASSSL